MSRHEGPTAARLADSSPRYLQIEMDLRRRLREGEFAEQVFPTDRELCQHYGVSRLTVHHALRALEAEGLLLRQRGRRTTVRTTPNVVLRRHPAQLILGFDIDMSVQGVNPRLELLAVEDRFADEAIASALQLRVGAPCVSITRIGSVRGEAVWLEHHVLPKDVGDAVRAQDFRNGLLASIIHQRIEAIAHVQLRVRAEIAGDEAAALLSIDADHPVLVSEYTFFSTLLRPLDQLVLRYRGDRQELDFSFDSEFADASIQSPKK